MACERASAAQRLFIPLMTEHKQSCKPWSAQTAANALIKATPLPVRDRSVIVRMKRRSTKPPLSAFGNIYPPFIVSYTGENVREKMQLKQQPPMLRNKSQRTTDSACCVYSVDQKCASVLGCVDFSWLGSGYSVIFHGCFLWLGKRA